jgi:CMP-N,N'-diacetyllegionaminic acid synthase
MISDTTFVIAVRKGSKRIASKNTKKFGNSSLLEIKLKQIRRLFPSSSVIVSSDCAKSLLIASKYTKNLDRRPKKYCTSFVPMKKVYKYLASKVKTTYVCYLHVTSPLLSDKTLLRTLKKISKIKKNKFDSIATVNLVKEYLWFKNKAINYNPNNHPKSQNLPNYYSLNFAINIIEKKKMEKYGKIVGKKFFPILLKFPENIDVDEKWQFIIADILYKKKIKF